MDFEIDFFRKFKQNWIFLLSGFIVFYFGFHTFCGERNIYRYFSLKNEIAREQLRSAEFKRQKNDLQKKVDLLSDNSVDIDMLDERARVVLNMVSEEEFVILDEDI